MRQIHQCLNTFLNAHISDLAQQNSHDDRNDNTDDNFGNGDNQRINDRLCGFFVLENSFEII
ncbi:hypothetical protein D3C76_1530710 [compost metagenome]